MAPRVCTDCPTCVDGPRGAAGPPGEPNTGPKLPGRALPSMPPTQAVSATAVTRQPRSARASRLKNERGISAPLAHRQRTWPSAWRVPSDPPATTCGVSPRPSDPLRRSACGPASRASSGATQTATAPGQSKTGTSEGSISTGARPACFDGGGRCRPVGPMSGVLLHVRALAPEEAGQAHGAARSFVGSPIRSGR